MSETKESIYTVTQLTQAIKDILEPSFRNIQLQGEISNFKRQSSGHLYFSLKDEQAQVSVVMFRGNAASLQTLPKDGDQVMVRGEISVYPPRGNYQLIVRELTPVGVGALLLKLEELKREIHRRGWSAKELKKPLPAMPRRIGVVTSPTGAAVQDILNVLTRRFADVHVTLNPVRVQGAEAAKEIAKAIEQFNRYQLADVLIVGRGGGSLEDLWAFNEEIVAEAIYKSQIPIICAVGHETDHCIADYVADVRAPTPSAAAEIVVAEKAQQKRQVEQLEKQLVHTMRGLVLQGRHRLEGVTRQPVFAQPYTLLGDAMQQLDEVRSDLEGTIRQQLKEYRFAIEGGAKQLHVLNPARQLTHLRQRFFTTEKALGLAMRRQLALFREKLEGVGITLRALDPKNLLKNGYSIVFSEKDRSVMNSVHQLEKGGAVRILVQDGEAAASVTDLYPGDAS